MKRVGFYTLGCKVSQYETEAIAEKFEACGYTVCDFSEVCDVYVINTCTVTAEADRKSRQMIRRAKKANPDSLVLVCGCYSQRSPGEVSAIAGVDAVIGSAGKLGLVEIAEKLLESKERYIAVTDIDSEPFENMRITRGPRTRVYVKIEDGCESKCTYCAIPSARGKVRSKPMADVLAEVRGLSASAYEIVLTGIETGSWGRDLPGAPTLADLIVELDKRKSCGRIRLGSLAPELLRGDFVAKVKDAAILAPHFHISIQSGSDNVLRAMKRRYTRAGALAVIEEIRAAIPRATFTTDIMVGFPGESEEDFMDSVRFVREARFIDAHVFQYSKRHGTLAADMPCQIDESVKHERSEKLIAVVKEVQENELDKLIFEGSELSALMEQKRGEYWHGHTDTFVEVAAKSDVDLHGKIVQVRPVTRKNAVLMGEIL